MSSIFPATKARKFRRPIHRAPIAMPTQRHKQHKEEDLQLRLSRYIKREYPQAILVGDFAAGANLTDGQRQKMMTMRSEDGQPDISLDFPSRGFHGLRLELKAEGTVVFKKDGTLRKASYTRRFANGTIKRGDHLAEQWATIQKYRELGYYADFIIGFDEAIKIVDWYMCRPENASLF